MKKYCSLLLILCLMFGLCACQSGKESAPQAFSVGFGRADVTSKTSVPLAGYGDTLNRMSEGILDYLYATCVAITDEAGETVLLYTVDLDLTRTDWMEDQRSKITAATGVPGDHIMVSATHTHSGPDILSQIQNTDPYYQVFTNGLVEAGKQAMADRSPATVSHGCTYVENLNFVRHYKLENGHMAGDNFGDFTVSKAVDYHHAADNQVQLIRFTRPAEDKKDIVMMNFGVHPKLASTAGAFYGQQNRMLQSADVVGGTRTYIEQNSDVLLAYYTAAAGNLNPLDPYMEGKNTTAQQSIQDYGKAMGTAVLEALPTLKEMTDTPLLKLTQTELAGELKNGGTEMIELNAISLGSLAFTTAPIEMFDTNGKQVKDGSPFETTFVLTMANGMVTGYYIPADHAWDYTTSNNTIPYEVKSSGFVRGTGEQIAEELVKLLNSLEN